MSGWFQNRLDKPIEERNYGSMYAMLSVVLLLTTLWAVTNEIDGRRPWKGFQEDFRKVKSRVLELRIKEARSKLDKGSMKALEKEIRQTRATLESDAMMDVKQKVDDISMQIRNKGLERADYKAVADSKNYFFEHSRKELHEEEAKAYLQERKDMEKKMEQTDKELADLEKKKADLLVKREPVEKKLKELVERKDSIYKSINDLMTKLDEAKSAPVKVRQVMINDMDRGNFGQLKMRVDRCQSCHLGIGDPVMADTNIFVKTGKGQVFKDEKYGAHWRKVFGPHPNNELIKKHDVEKFGCTGCHGGQSMAVDDVDHAHGKQEHWERPLLTGGYMESNCRSCHEGTYQFGDLQWISTGRKLFIDMGCFSCHDAPGNPDWQTYKTGPSLLNVGKKLDPQWVFQWVQNPYQWNGHTRMPNFYLTPEQTEATVAYLFDQSKGSTWSPVSASVPSGDAERGKQVIEEVGCVACHSVGADTGRGNFLLTPPKTKESLWKNASVTGDRVAEGNMFGPDLNKVGSKLSGAWLYDWVKNPKHYSPTARMPSMRLSDGEAADITAYLMTLKDPSPPAAVSLTHLNDPEWIKKGKSLISEYGCFGCHLINGMENEGKVSVGLSDFGKKGGADLYFGYATMKQLYSVRRHFDSSGYRVAEIHTHVHNGEDWFTWALLKMKNPRFYATDAIAQKMPDFNMSDREAYALTVFLRSQTKDYVPVSFSKQYGSLQEDVDNGRFFTHWNNCQGCHAIEGQGGYVKEILGKEKSLKGDDILPYAPPNLNTVGAKIQESWFYNFLNDPSTTPVRTWLKIRMPTYGFSADRISVLYKYFLGLEHGSLNFTDYSQYPTTEETLAAGKALFVKLNCQKCHAAGASPSNGGDAAVPVPNLGLAGNRLKPEWIERWLRDPSAIVPGSKMPGFWGSVAEPVKPDATILGGDIDKQIKALRDYVWRIGGPKGGVAGGGSGSVEAPGAATIPTVPAAASATPAGKPADTAGAKKLSMR